MKICFATNNQHKLEEVAAALGNGFQLVTLKELSVFEELPETQETLEGNALQKAQYLFDKLQIACFADDTGLEVESLNGEPGVYSARYAGSQRKDDDNIELLFSRLYPYRNRRARFRTVIAYVDASGTPTLFEGMIAGEIATEKKGTNGFGYDPVFVPDGYNKTFAEMSLTEKNQISHRTQAVKKFVDHLLAKK